MFNIKTFFRFSTRIVTSQTDTLKLFKKFYSWKPKKIYAFYNSQFDKIITQQHLMLMPIDQRVATRSHAASQIVEIKNQKLINIDLHTRKLFEHAKSLAIQPCLKEDVLLGKIIETVKAGFAGYLHENTKEDLAKEVFELRVIFSSGHGDFGIAARDNGCVFYAIVSEAKTDPVGQGVKEYTIREMHFDIEEYNLSKTGYEIEHSIMKDEAKKKGGFSGIKYTKDKILLEASSGNLGFVFDNPFELVIPRKSKVIEGETLTQALEYLNSEKGQNKIKVIEKDVSIQEAYSAKQMIIFGKDDVIPVLSLNDKVISEKRGPVTKKLQKWYQQTLQQGVTVQI